MTLKKRIEQLIDALIDASPDQIQAVDQELDTLEQIIVEKQFDCI